MYFTPYLGIGSLGGDIASQGARTPPGYAIFRPELEVSEAHFFSYIE